MSQTGGIAGATTPAGAPRVTVLTTLYNKGAYVREAVQSVLAQTFTDLELLVVDDASTDDGLEQVRQFTDPRIRIMESPVNTGRPAAANRGFEAARGEYIAILDADDLMAPDRLKEQVRYLDEHPEVAVVGSWMRCHGIHEQLWKYPLEDREIKGRLLWKVDVTYPSCMFRRSILVEHGLRCNEAWLLPGMDHFFMLGLGRYGAYANLAEPLTHYRIGEQNMRHGRDPLKDRVARNVEVLRIFGLPGGEHVAESMALLEDPALIDLRTVHIRGINRSIRSLKKHVHQRKLFPLKEFDAYVDRRWYQLFFSLGERPRVALYYLLLNRSGRSISRFLEVLWRLRRQPR